MPLSTLTSSPYSLALGDSVYAQVETVNFYGVGGTSASGNGATCVLVPSPPTSLINNGAVTNVNRVGFSWTNGPSTGGSRIIDYQVWWDKGIGSYEILASGVLT